MNRQKYKSQASEELGFEICIHEDSLYTPHFWFSFFIVPIAIVWSIKPHIIQYQTLLQCFLSACCIINGLLKALKAHRVLANQQLSKLYTTSITDLSRVTPFCVFANYNLENNEGKASWRLIYPWQCSKLNYRRICRHIIKIQL